MCCTFWSVAPMFTKPSRCPSGARCRWVVTMTPTFGSRLERVPPACLLHIGASVEIEDLGSTNGTHVGAVRIPPRQRVPLAIGQSVVIGGITLVLQHQYVRSAKLRVRSHGYFYDRLIEECAHAEADAKTTLGLLRIRLGATATKSAASTWWPRRCDRETLWRPTRPANTKCCCQIRGRRNAVRLPPASRRRSPKSAAAHAWAWPAFPRTALRQARSWPTPARRRAAATTRLRLVQFVCDAQMMALYQKARQAAKANANVLILGETGVGKEVLANYIHSESRRADKPFLKLNCACRGRNSARQRALRARARGFHRSQQVAQGAHPSR